MKTSEYFEAFCKIWFSFCTEGLINVGMSSFLIICHGWQSCYIVWPLTITIYELRRLFDLIYSTFHADLKWQDLKNIFLLTQSRLEGQGRACHLSFSALMLLAILAGGLVAPYLVWGCGILFLVMMLASGYCDYSLLEHCFWWCLVRQC